jgi:D-sedoheptulose 7-phosphate isomerase
VTAAVGTDLIGAALAERTRSNAAFFAADAERLARLCHSMAERFARGGRLIAFGDGPGPRSDARHIAVEFVHPVIVGKRALPAIGIADEGGPIVRQVELLAEPDDIVVGFGTGADPRIAGPHAAVADPIRIARTRGCLTIAFGPVAAEWEFEPPSADPSVRQELVETLYHLLWELVHVFFEHRGLLQGREAKRVHDTGASSFLYPFLAEAEHDLDAVLADVSASVRMKAAEIGELREQTLGEGREALLAAAADVRAADRVLALGNGGSATDAMDLVADFRCPPVDGWKPRPALDLTEDAAILTAIANDIGTEAIFARQIIAYGREGDALIALSTSGNSANVIAALAEARKRSLRTIAMVGYDGGRVASEHLADHVIITRSEHIPRIQEAQASAYHVLRALVEMSG